jgi:hypothetical protein
LSDWWIAHILLAVGPPAVIGTIALFEVWFLLKSKRGDKALEPGDRQLSVPPQGKPPLPQEINRRVVATFSYSEAGFVFGVATGIVTFLGAYIYCIFSYGFLFGLGLGWLPSGILAIAAGLTVALFWGPLLGVFALVLICGAVVVVNFR